METINADIFFQTVSMSHGWGSTKPSGGEVLAGKLGVSWSFLKRANLREKAPARFAFEVNKPFLPIAG